MKIGILTHYNVYNLGARLQLDAMYRYLEDLGHTPVVLTYEKNFDFIPEEAKKNSASWKALPYYIKHYIFEKGLGLTLFNVRKVKAIDKSRRQFTYMPYDDNDCDAVIIGSDEVFSIDVGCNKMMYGHGLTAPAVAYAPSFGRTTERDLRMHDCYELVQNGLRNITWLSARDTHTQQMIFGMTGRTVPLVCDPVLLYDGHGFATEDGHVGKPYLLIYSYDSNMTESSEIAALQAFARKHNLITVSVGTYHKWCDKNVVCTPESWIGWFRAAACVVTDTFHGSIVAIKNHCNVAIYIRESINSFKLRSLLDETGLQERRLTEITASQLEKVLTHRIHYDVVDPRLERMAKNGDVFLKNALEAVHGSCSD